MMSKKEEKINKVEEPITTYESNSTSENEIELHPVLEQLLEKSIKQADEGKLISHDDVMRKVKEKYPFLK